MLSVLTFVRTFPSSSIADYWMLFATDTSVIRDGTIVTQIFAGKIEPND